MFMQPVARSGGGGGALDRNEPIARILPNTQRGALVVREPLRTYRTFRDIPLPPPVRRDIDPVELLLEDRQT